MKKEITVKLTFTVEEIVNKLKIPGEVLSCSLNLKQKVDSPLKRNLVMTVREGRKK